VLAARGDPALILARYASDGTPDSDVATALRLARDFDAGLAFAGSLPEHPRVSQVSWTSPDLIRGEFLWLAGRTVEARAPLERNRDALAALLRDKAEDPRLHAAMGLNLALLGDTQAAVSAAERAVELIPYDRDAMEAGEWVFYLAAVQAIAGRAADAVATLDRYLGMPGYFGTAFIEADPRFDSLRELPAFGELLARHGDLSPPQGAPDR
jgi:tetratricopeptide (TPR) repeat protein